MPWGRRYKGRSNATPPRRDRSHARFHGRGARALSRPRSGDKLQGPRLTPGLRGTHGTAGRRRRTRISWQCVAVMRRSPVEVKLPRSLPRCLCSMLGGALGFAPACRSTTAYGGGSPSFWVNRQCSPVGRLCSVLPLVQCARAAQPLRRLGSASRRCAGRLSR